MAATSFRSTTRGKGFSIKNNGRREVGAKRLLRGVAVQDTLTVSVLTEADCWSGVEIWGLRKIGGRKR